MKGVPAWHPYKSHTSTQSVLLDNCFNTQTVRNFLKPLTIIAGPGTLPRIYVLTLQLHLHTCVHTATLSWVT